MNTLWHEQHKMPTRATVEQRVRWHLEHAKHCGCRPVPRSVLEEMKKRGISISVPTLSRTRIHSSGDHVVYGHPTSTGEKSKMSAIEKNKRIITRYFDEVWNQGRLEVLDELIAPNYINHSPGAPNPKPGPEGLKPIVEALRKGMPDVKYTIQDMVITPDKVAVRVVMTGTHTGDFFGIAPTGKHVTVNQFQIERIENGKIVEHWRQTDDLGMMRQLGLLPESK